MKLLVLVFNKKYISFTIRVKFRDRYGLLLIKLELNNDNYTIISYRYSVEPKCNSINLFNEDMDEFMVEINNKLKEHVLKKMVYSTAFVSIAQQKYHKFIFS